MTIATIRKQFVSKSKRNFLRNKYRNLLHRVPCSRLKGLIPGRLGPPCAMPPLSPIYYSTKCFILGPIPNSSRTPELLFLSAQVSLLLLHRMINMIGSVTPLLVIKYLQTTQANNRQLFFTCHLQFGFGLLYSAKTTWKNMGRRRLHIIPSAMVFVVDGNSCFSCSNDCRLRVVLCVCLAVIKARCGSLSLMVAFRSSIYTLAQHLDNRGGSCPRTMQTYLFVWGIFQNLIVLQQILRNP